MSKSIIEFEMGNIKKIYDIMNDSIREFILNNIKNYNKTEFFYLTFNKDNFIQSTLYDSKNTKKEYLFEEWNSGEKKFIKTYDNINDVVGKTAEYLNKWGIKLVNNNRIYNKEIKKNSKKNKKNKSNKKNNNIILDDYEKNNESVNFDENNKNKTSESVIFDENNKNKTSESVIFDENNKNKTSESVNLDENNSKNLSNDNLSIFNENDNNKNNVLSVLDLKYNPYNNKNAFVKLEDKTRIEIENKLKNLNSNIDSEVDLYKAYKSKDFNNSFEYNLTLDIESFYGRVYIFKKTFKRRKLKENQLLTGKWINHDVSDWTTIIYSTDNPNKYNLESFSNDKKHMHKSILDLDFSKKELTLNMVEAKCGCQNIKDEEGHWYEKDNYQYISCKSLRVKKKIDELIFMNEKEYFKKEKCELGKNTYNFLSKFKDNEEIEEEQIGIMVVSNQDKNDKKAFCEIKSANLLTYDIEDTISINENINKLDSNTKNRFSGMNDQPYGEDLLDYKSYAKILSKIITKKMIKPPLTFGIYSSWGNGKSFLLNLIEKEIKRDLEYTNFCYLYDLYKKIQNENYLFIKFNAWEYSGSDILWAGLIKCLYDNVENEFGSTFVRLYFALSDTGRYDVLFFVLKLLFLLIGFIFYYYFKDFIGGLISLISGILITLVALFPNLKTIYQTVSKGHFNILKNQLGSIEEKIGFMAIVRKKLDKLISLLKFTNCQAIVFIDDLDRCTNEKAVDVLNAVQLLLSNDSSNFYTFIAIDPRLIINAIETKYHNENGPNINGYEFMDKIINIPFTIPKMLDKSKNNFMTELLNEVSIYNIADYEIDLIFKEVCKIKYDKIPQKALFLIDKYNLKDKHFFRLTYNNFCYYFYLNPKGTNPKGEIFYCDKIGVYAFKSKIYYKKKDKILVTKIFGEEVTLEESYELIIDDTNDTNRINTTNDTSSINDLNETIINNTSTTSETNDMNNTNRTIDINDTNITSETNDMNDTNNININIIDESNDINNINQIIDINDTNITSETNDMNDTNNININIIDDSNNINQIIDVNNTNNLDIINETSITSETSEISEKNELKEAHIIDHLEKKVFSEYSIYLDSNGRRMKRIMNMYFVSRDYFYKKRNTNISFVNRNMLLPNIIFAEQWPYCLTMIIVYLENLLFNGKKPEYISELKIIDILNKLKNKLFLSDKWRKLSYNDSRIDKLEIFLKHLDETNFNSYLLFFIQKNFIFNLNPSIKSYILRDIDELKLNEIR
jgi:hypothetical protein